MAKKTENKGRRHMSTPKHSDDFEEMPLNKYVAKCGVASRRKSAEIIKKGEIRVNGQVERNPAYRVQINDKVFYKGERLTKEHRKVYYLMNKPKDTITTVSDDRNRKTVIDLLKKVDQRVFPVGRLDRQTTGLLLITNDGDLAQKLSHPSNQVRKIYHVTLDKLVREADLEQIRKGLELEDGKALVDAVNYIGDLPRNNVGIELHIGKNRIVRRIFEHLGYRVEKLDRTYYAGLTKKDLPRGWYRPLSKKEVIMLKHFTK